MPPGGLVFDPFAGSGAHGEGVLRAGRRYLGCELVPGIAEAAAARLRAVEVDADPHAMAAGQQALFAAQEAA